MRRIIDLLLPVLTLPGIAVRAGEFVFRRPRAEDGILPVDAADGTVDGPDPDRVVVIGESGMVALGVRTHGIALPACFARQLATRTGRGVVWTSVVLRDSRVRDAVEEIERTAPELERADAVVLLVGVTDALRVTSARAWERHLAAAVAGIRTHLPRDGWILVADIPPLDGIAGLSRPARAAAGLHGRVLNRRTRAVLATIPNTCAVAFPEELMRADAEPEAEESRSRQRYRIWGGHLARALTGARGEG